MFLKIGKDSNNSSKITPQPAIFLAVLGPYACEIYDNLKFEAPDDKNNLKKLMKKLEDFFVVDTHEAFESYKFHLRK